MLYKRRVIYNIYIQSDDYEIETPIEKKTDFLHRQEKLSHLNTFNKLY